MMKKVIVTLLTVLVIICFAAPSVCAYASEVTDENYKDEYAYRFIKEFAEKFPDRRAGYDGLGNANNVVPSEQSVQAYLKNAMEAILNGRGQAKYLYFGDSSKYFNIEARLIKDASAKQIIIGAHYDTAYKGGANDNASGIAALLMIMQTFCDNFVQLPCNVTFVAFDAEESGMTGSYEYVNSMSLSEKNDTLLMINLDSLANGDNLYVWCENKHTALADLFVKNEPTLNEKPYAVGTFAMDLFGYGYYELIQGSDNTPFRLNGIPCASFFSGTFSARAWSYAESADMTKNTMNTTLDTFENLDGKNGKKFVEQINAAVNAVTATVISSEFMSAVQKMPSEMLDLNLWYNSLWPMLILLGILVILAVIAVFYNRKLQKNAILGTAEAKKSGKMFSAPDAEDVFTFNDKK